MHVAAERFGNHRVRFVPPDLFHVVFDGDVSRDEARQLSELFSARTAGIDYRMLVDLRQLGTIRADGRRELSAQRRAPRTDREYHIDLVFIGSSLRTKVLVTTVIAAARLLSNVRLVTYCVWPRRARRGERGRADGARCAGARLRAGDPRPAPRRRAADGDDGRIVFLTAHELDHPLAVTAAALEDVYVRQKPIDVDELREIVAGHQRTTGSG